MRKVILLMILMFLTKISFLQVEVRDSVYIRVDKLGSNQITYQISDGRILGVSVYIKNKYETLTGFTKGQFGSNLILKQKHKLDPNKVITYKRYVELINKNLMDVFLHYKIYFILSEAKYDYLILQVRQIVHYQE